MATVPWWGLVTRTSDLEILKVLVKRTWANWSGLVRRLWQASKSSRKWRSDRMSRQLNVLSEGTARGTARAQPMAEWVALCTSDIPDPSCLCDCESLGWVVSSTEHLTEEPRIETRCPGVKKSYFPTFEEDYHVLFLLWFRSSWCFYELIASRVRVNFGLSALGQSLRHWLLGGSESLNEWQCSNISLTSK